MVVERWCWCWCRFSGSKCVLCCCPILSCLQYLRYSPALGFPCQLAGSGRSLPFFLYLPVTTLPSPSPSPFPPLPPPPTTIVVVKSGLRAVSFASPVFRCYCLLACLLAIALGVCAATARSLPDYTLPYLDLLPYLACPCRVPAFGVESLSVSARFLLPPFCPAYVPSLPCLGCLDAAVHWTEHCIVFFRAAMRTQ